MLKDLQVHMVGGLEVDLLRVDRSLNTPPTKDSQARHMRLWLHLPTHLSRH